MAPTAAAHGDAEGPGAGAATPVPCVGPGAGAGRGEGGGDAAGVPRSRLGELVDLALGALIAAGDELAAGSGVLTQEQALDAADDVERVARRVHQLRVLATGVLMDGAPLAPGAGALGAPEIRPQPRSPYSTPRHLMRARLRISGAEASRRIALAGALTPSRSLSGQEVPVRHPQLAAAVVSGDVGQESATRLVKSMEQVRHLATPEQADAMESHLVEHAAQLDPDAMARLAARWVQGIDQDGPVPSEEELARQCGIFPVRVRHGLHHLRVVVTAADMETLSTVFSAGANPRVNLAVVHGDACDHISADDGDGACDEGVASEADRSFDGDVDLDHNRALRGGVAFEGDRGSDHGVAPHRGRDLGADRAEQDGVRGGSPSTSPTAPDRLPGGEADGAGPGPGLDAADGGEAEADVGASELNASSLGVAHLPWEPPDEAPDRTSLAFRRLNALLAACNAAMRSRALPDSGGVATQVIVTMDVDALRDGIGSAFLQHEGPVSASRTRAMACDAEVIPVVLGADSRMLDLGRSHRTAPPWMRRALMARDGGCAFPGCVIPASWCEAHHLCSWARGGRTSIENLVLLCPFHHKLVESGAFSVMMRDGVPWFDPPWRTATHRGMHRNGYHRPPIPLSA